MCALRIVYTPFEIAHLLSFDRVVRPCVCVTRGFLLRFIVIGVCATDARTVPYSFSLQFNDNKWIGMVLKTLYWCHCTVDRNAPNRSIWSATFSLYSKTCKYCYCLNKFSTYFIIDFSYFKSHLWCILQLSSKQRWIGFYFCFLCDCANKTEKIRGQVKYN